MIFQYTWQAVLDGSKTLTHRAVRPGDHMGHWKGVPAVLRENGRLRWRVGQELAVQPARRERAVGRIRITALWRADVREMPLEHLRAEGYDSHTEFWSLWISLHDKTYARQLAASRGRVDAHVEELMKRPARYYDAWAIQFQLIEEPLSKPRNGVVS